MTDPPQPLSPGDPNDVAATERELDMANPIFRDEKVPSTVLRSLGRLVWAMLETSDMLFSFVD